MTQASYKYETHCHTSEASACSHSSGAEMVQAYKSTGYSGLIITDHFFNGNTGIDQNLLWQDRVSAFYKGYENAKEAAKDMDFEVFFGWEYGYKGTEFLTYGLDIDFLLDHPDMLDWSILEYFDRVHEAGGFISHAHPFRERFYIKKIRLYPEYVDAIEVVNSGNSKEIFNEKALEYAKKHHLIQTKGSDSHDANKLSGEGMFFDHRLESIHDFIESLKSSID